MRLRLTLVCALAALVQVSLAEWQARTGPLTTPWTNDVSVGRVHPEYPRPQMVRPEWLNLNGLWRFEIAARGVNPGRFDREILVPFPIESALSGVMERVPEDHRVVYVRRFDLPPDWTGKRILLRCGAADFETTVRVNGQTLGVHRGGYDSFSFDITDALLPEGLQELRLDVADPTDAGTQPRGKQVRKPEGIWYTPTTGIWQTIWLEPVPAQRIEFLKLTPDVDNSTLQVEADAVLMGRGNALEAVVLDGEKEVARASGPTPLTIHIPSPRLWSPSTPFLYDLRLRLVAKGGGAAGHEGRVLDEVASYFGMRKVSLGPDERGVTRILLNNEPLFMFGPLDQGFWPDGLYTAPTDDALRYDIEMTRRLGFNTCRKHVKVEPERWYYWCDKLGLLVWQDMPSGDKYIGPKDPDIERSPESARQFELELRRMIDSHYNHPCIVMWVVFNEGWGQYDTARLAEWVKKHDPSRLVNSASGWTDRGVGDVFDIHDYPGPKMPELEQKRAAVLGEFGGLGLPVRGHTWQEEKNWGYKSFDTADALTAAYLKLTEDLRPPVEKGLAAAIYTQTTDVEIEVNGLMTYDRKQVKPNADSITKVNREVIQLGSKSESAAVLPVSGS